MCFRILRRVHIISGIGNEVNKMCENEDSGDILESGECCGKNKLDINRPMRQSPALILTQLMQHCFYLNQVILSHLNDSVFSLELSVIVSSVNLPKEKSCRFRFLPGFDMLQNSFVGLKSTEIVDVLQCMFAYEIESSVLVEDIILHFTEFF